MADLSAVLGFPGLLPGEKLASLTPRASRQTKTPDNEIGARAILAQLRTSDASYKDPLKQKRRFLRSKEKTQELANPDGWTFTPYEIGRGLGHYFDQPQWQPPGVAQALLDMGNGATAQDLWHYSLDSTLEQPPSKRQSSTSSISPPSRKCPWLDRAVERKALPIVVMLCAAGSSKENLDEALEKALRHKEYDIARELVCAEASFPTSSNLFDAAASATPPDFGFLKLWLSAPLLPSREFAFNAIRAAASSPPDRYQATLFSLLLANVPVSADEVYELLLDAIKARNLAAMAALSLRIQHQWARIRGRGTTITHAASKIGDAGKRLRVLDFLLSAGAKPNTSSLRKRLFLDATSNNIDGVEQLTRFGVSPYRHADEADADALSWAVENVRMDVFNVLIRADIPASVASVAIEKIPHSALETDKIELVRALGTKGAKGESLSRLLINAVKTPCQPLIDLLLQLGATANFIDRTQGNSLIIAVKRCDVALTNRLCATRPSPAIASAAVSAAFAAMTKGNSHDIIEIMTLLVAQGACGAKVEETILQAIPTFACAGILRSLLPAGIRPPAAGKAVLKVIQLSDSKPLQMLCDATEIPAESLESSLREVLYGRTYDKVKALRLLKVAQQKKQVAMLNKLLTSDARENHSQGQDIMFTLLAHGASVNTAGGSVLVDAVKAADTETVGKLLAMKPNDTTLRSALWSVIDLRPKHVRINVADLILKASRADIGQSAVLLRVVQEKDQTEHAMALIQLLLRYRASVNFDNGKTLVEAVGSGDLKLVTTVINGTRDSPEPETLALAFKMSLSLPKSPRLPIAKLLLNSGVDSITRSRHLLDVIKSHDTSLLALMLAPGDTSWSHDNSSLENAVKLGYLPEVQLLMESGVPYSVVVAVFQCLVTAAARMTMKTNSMAIARSLLGIQLSTEDLDNSLSRVFRESSTALPGDFIEILLEHGADTAVDSGICFGTAAAKNDLLVFKKLTAQKFDLDVAVRAIIKALDTESDVINWLDLCVADSTLVGSHTLCDHNIVLFAIEKFPAGQQLLVFLLENGCEPGLQVLSEDGSEEITLLMWMMSEPGRATDEVVLELLERRDRVKPDFVAQSTAMSAMHLAALHGRVLILQRLIELRVDVDFETAEGFTPLCLATLGGNIEVMTLLTAAGAKPNDGSLHIAARAPNIEFITLLKDHLHDVQWPASVFDGRPPLAELCYAGRGTGPRWEKSVRATMQLLVPLLDHTWKFSNGTKTVLHLALDNPVSAVPLVRAFLDISQLWRHSGRDDDYLFVDDITGLRYSPTKYVELLCPEKSAQEKRELVNLLRTSRFTDRYFAAIGNQPAGAVGLPIALRDALQEEQQAEWKQQQDIRRAEELAARQAQANEELNRKTLAHLGQQAQKDIELARRKAILEREDERRKGEMLLEQQQSLTSQQLEAQWRQGEQALRIELARQTALQEAGRWHQWEQQRLEREHTDMLNERRIQAQGRAGQIESQMLERRLELEYGHQAKMMSLQADMMRQQVAMRKALPAPDYDKRSIFSEDVD